MTILIPRNTHNSILTCYGSILCDDTPIHIASHLKSFGRRSTSKYRGKLFYFMTFMTFVFGSISTLTGNFAMFWDTGNRKSHFFCYCFHPCLSVCLLTRLLKIYWSNLYGILWTIFWVTLTQGHSESKVKVKVNKDQKVKLVVLRITPLKIVVDSRH